MLVVTTETATVSWFRFAYFGQLIWYAKAALYFQNHGVLSVIANKLRVVNVCFRVAYWTIRRQTTDCYWLKN